MRQWQPITGVVAFVLGLVLGVIDLILLFRGAPEAQVFFLLVACLLLLSAAFFFYWLFSCPPWTVLTATYHCEFLDSGPNEAKVRKTLVLRSNVRQNKYYTHQSVGADGVVDPTFKTNAVAIKPRQQAKRFALVAELQEAVHFLGTAEHWVEVIYRDSFPAAQEIIFLQVEDPTKRIEFRLRFDPGRPPTPGSQRAYFQGAQQERALAQPTLNGSTLSWTHKSLPFNTLKPGQYAVSWRW